MISASATYDDDSSGVCVFHLFPRHHTQRLGVNALGVPQASLQLPVEVD